MKNAESRIQSVGAKQTTAKKCISIDFGGSFRFQTALRGSKLPPRIGDLWFLAVFQAENSTPIPENYRQKHG